ncbi:anthranilate synthase component 1 [Gallaecimonas kandeliae]|uniref:anthranilate synthase component 1 n=1 Tax=Gallaecimonas kandeliae TaxID=3029055 RepID=UPI0026472A59|nr:anthranilate synthase component 1 [Gallaecimonas kandeliae]WKE66932.1 anthranilate synthase component 1 [Gallaecimonas kandeliae]
MRPALLRLRLGACPDPLVAYRALGAKTHSLLLESAEPSAGNATQSLVITDAALKITALGRTVTVQALTANGEVLLPVLAERLNAQVEGNTFSLSFEQPDTELDEDSRLKAPSVFTVLRELLALLPKDADLPFESLVAGLFGFDLVASLEDLPELDGNERVPDLCLYLAETALYLNHRTGSATLLALALGGQGSASYFELSRRLAGYQQQLAQAAPLPALAIQAPPQARVEPDDEAFKAQVSALKEHILAGDCFQVVPSRRFLAPCPAPLISYQALRAQNPSPYMFYLNAGDFVLFGASPESALTVDSQSRELAIYPIAGTRPRGSDADEDSRFELEMRLDEKEQAEHLMLVDLARNDVARVSEPASRTVTDLLKVDRYEKVMHLVSRVKGTLRGDLDALHAYQSALNMGTLSGAPKLMATRLIRETEGRRRGAYGGAIGYLTARGDMDSAIVIRSALVQDGVACVQAGAGVVYDSVPQLEADETRHKAASVLRALGAVEVQS